MMSKEIEKAAINLIHIVLDEDCGNKSNLPHVKPFTYGKISPAGIRIRRILDNQNRRKFTK